MNKLIFLIFLVPCFIFYSCKDEKKEKYLNALDKTLDKDISWILSSIESRNHFSKVVFQAEGKPIRMKKLHDECDSIFVEFNKFYKKQNDTIKSTKEIIKIIEFKNSILQKAQVSNRILENLTDSIRELEGVQFNYYGDIEIVKTQDKLVLKKGESLKVKVKLGNKPSRFSPETYNAFIDNTELYANKSALFNYSISGDSTIDMKAGNYNIYGVLKINIRGRDSIFEFNQPYQIIPPICID